MVSGSANRQAIGALAVWHHTPTNLKNENPSFLKKINENLKLAGLGWLFNQLKGPRFHFFFSQDP
jgi:hypothetical protein